ncbi:MAG: aminopeptidase P family N-terminal domain-containing protein [Kosmotogaceae bacterium]
MRTQLVREYLNQKGYDAILIGNIESLFWLFERSVDPRKNGSYFASDFFVYIDNDRTVVILPERDKQRIVQEKLPNYKVDYETYPWFQGPISIINSFSKNKRLATDCASFAKLPNTEYVDNDFKFLQLQFSEREVSRLRAIGTLSENMLYEFSSELRSGLTEIDIEKILKALFQEIGLEVLYLVVLSDERLEKYYSANSTGKKIKKHLGISLRAHRLGLCVSLSRSFYFGKVPSDLAELYDKAAALFARSAYDVMQIERFAEILKKAKSNYSSIGYENEWKSFDVNHSAKFGIENLAPLTEMDFLVKENMAFSFSTPLKFARSEDTVLLKDSSTAELITLGNNFPKIVVNVENMKVMRPWIIEL